MKDLIKPKKKPSIMTISSGAYFYYGTKVISMPGSLRDVRNKSYVLLVGKNGKALGKYWVRRRKDYLYFYSQTLIEFELKL